MIPTTKQWLEAHFTFGADTKDNLLRDLEERESQVGQEAQLQWASYMPALTACLAVTDGPVLELGVGHFSTPVLHAYCQASARVLISVEKNEDWLKKFDHYVCKLHRLFQTSDYANQFKVLDTERWGVVLVDGSPGGRDRLACLQSFLPISDFVVVHDMQPEGDNYQAIMTNGVLLGVGHSRLLTDYFPHTLVASLTREIPI